MTMTGSPADAATAAAPPAGGTRRQRRTRTRWWARWGRRTIPADFLPVADLSATAVFGRGADTGLDSIADLSGEAAGTGPCGATGKARAGGWFARDPQRPRGRLLRRLDVGWYEVAETPILTSTRQAEALNTALVSTHPPVAGAPSGVNVENGQPLTADPHELYNAVPRRVNSANVVILGAVGVGKSEESKKQYTVRPVALGRQVVVFDRKDQQGRGEYGRAASIAGGLTLRFSRYGGTVVNILDPRITTTSDTDGGVVGQDLLLLMVAEHAHGPLDSKARFALRAAHRTALVRASGQGRVAVLSDVVDALYDPDDNAIPHPAAARIDSRTGLPRITVDDVASWGLTLALDLGRFIDGDLSGLIDGQTRGENGEELDLSAPLLVIDTSALPEDSPALALVMATMATYLAALWAASPGQQRLLIVEEGYHAGSDRLTSVATILRSLAKRGRGLGLCVVSIFHHISDVPKDSEIMSLIREAGIVQIFKQDKSDDAAMATELFGLPSWVRDQLPLLDTGVNVQKIGSEHPVIVKGLRTELEEWFCDTDDAMGGRIRAEAAPFASSLPDPGGPQALDLDVRGEDENV